MIWHRELVNHLVLNMLVQNDVFESMDADRRKRQKSDFIFRPILSQNTGRAGERIYFCVVSLTSVSTPVTAMGST